MSRIRPNTQDRSSNENNEIGPVLSSLGTSQSEYAFSTPPPHVLCYWYCWFAAVKYFDLLVHCM